MVSKLGGAFPRLCCCYYFEYSPGLLQFHCSVSTSCFCWKSVSANRLGDYLFFSYSLGWIKNIIGLFGCWKRFLIALKIVSRLNFNYQFKEEILNNNRIFLGIHIIISEILSLSFLSHSLPTVTMRLQHPVCPVALCVPDNSVRLALFTQRVPILPSMLSFFGEKDIDIDGPTNCGITQIPDPISDLLGWSDMSPQTTQLENIYALHDIITNALPK